MNTLLILLAPNHQIISIKDKYYQVNDLDMRQVGKIGKPRFIVSHKLSLVHRYKNQVVEKREHYLGK